MSVFTQIVILLLVLSAMVMVLLAIRQLTHFERFDDSEETRILKEEVEDRSEIVSSNSIFGNLVETKRTDYSSKTKEPVSRKK